MSLGKYLRFAMIRKLQALTLWQSPLRSWLRWCIIQMASSQVGEAAQNWILRILLATLIWIVMLVTIPRNSEINQSCYVPFIGMLFLYTSIYLEVCRSIIPHNGTSGATAWGESTSMSAKFQNPSSELRSDRIKSSPYTRKRGSACI